MDPFVVVAFSKKVFRTRVVRHSLNPIFDEKLFFHVRRSETGFQVQLTVLDWDKLSLNDLVGDATFGVKELIEAAPKPDGETGLYAVDDEEEGVEKGMKVFRLELATVGNLPGGVKPAVRFRYVFLLLNCSPTPTHSFYRAQYYPYDALRQRFWRHYLAQYDTDNNGTFSRLELTTMLDSLGSTLSRRTISTFFTRYGKDPKTDEISVDQAVICLEEELARSEESSIRDVDEVAEANSAEPVVMIVGDHGEEVKLDLDQSFGAMHFSGLPHVVLNGTVHETQPMQMLLEHAAAGTGLGGATEPTNGHGTTNDNDRDVDDDVVNADTPPSQAASYSNSTPRERVVNVHNCPFCHRPRLDSKAAIDVVTHIALCASQDWTKVDRIMVGNFVTANEAERKWYVQAIMDIGAGEYKLGAVCGFLTLVWDDELMRWCSIFRIRPMLSCRIGRRASLKKRRCKCMSGWGLGCCIKDF
jgi:phosphatidylserine decarboxylase